MILVSAEPLLDLCWVPKHDNNASAYECRMHDSPRSAQATDLLLNFDWPLNFTFFSLSEINLSKRLNYVNHARRLADGDWTGADSDGEDMDKQDEGEREQDGNTEEEEGMEVERRKLPKHYANQVSGWCVITEILTWEGQPSLGHVVLVHSWFWPAGGACASGIKFPIGSLIKLLFLHS